MLLGFLSLLSMLFLTSISHAENSFIASAYNQIKNGRTCGQVTKADLKSAGFSCGFGQPVEKLSISAWEIFEWNVFKIAAENQIDKNQCLTAQIHRLKDPANKDDLKAWSTQVAIAWLDIKRADLLLERCHMQMAKRAWTMKSAGPIAKPDSSIDPRCNDPKEIAKIHESKQLASMSVPIISDPQFFKIFEKHRETLINEETGKPLTDEEILAKPNLENLDFLNLKHSDAFEKDLRRNLLDYAIERGEVTRELEKFKSGKMVSLPADLRDFIHQDATLYQTLVSKDFLPTDHKGIDTTKTQVSNGAFCMLARYEPTIIGEFIDMSAKSALYGGFLFRIFQGTKAAAVLSKAHVKSVFDHGSYGITAHLASEQIYKSCMNKYYQSRKTVPGELKRKVSLKLGPILECKKAEDKNLMLNESHLTNCVQDALLSLIP